MKYCDIIKEPIHHERSPKKDNTNREIRQLKYINPLLGKRKIKIRYRSTPRYKMPFWHLIRVIQTQLHEKGFVVPMDGTMSYRTFSNYNELCTKYHLLSMFFYKSYCHPTKGVLFPDSKYDVLTIHNNFFYNAATSSFVIKCWACLNYKTTEFLSF